MKKKFAALLLAMVMVLSLIVPASAAGTDGDDIADALTDVQADEATVAEDEPTVEDGASVENDATEDNTDAAQGGDEAGSEALDASEAAEDTGVLTVQNLTALYDELDGEYEAPATATQADVLVYLLRYAGLADSQISFDEPGTEQFVYDSEQLFISMGILPSDYDADAECTVEQLNALREDIQPLYDALHADKLEPLFMNGMAQPIFPYTEASYATGNELTYQGYDWVQGENGWEQQPVEKTTPEMAGTSNDSSDIIRFCVYVETNYDTDGDGKLDLVKTLVQLPKAVVDGDYKAATIYEARPYITGCTSWSDDYIEGGYDLESMYNTPAERTAAGNTTTAEHAAAANPDDWMYWNPQEESWAYEDLTWYDYYLVRGFAVVECGGLGTKGSDGFETCGTDLEIDAFKCVIEWLNGDRVAYTDKVNNIAIEADWSSGNVGMTGRSYAGTTQFGLSTTGVAGLKTIVPVAGIASWYEYTNSQGVAMSISYSDYLATYCAGRYLDDEDYATIAESYGKYLQQISDDEYALNGDYGKHWATRDYTVDPLLPDWKGIKIPALIVHGLNDTNVRTKEFDLMYKSFKDAGQNVKLLLHQGTHLTPTYPSQRYEMLIGDEYYDSILNKWFSHYLCGVDNGIENIANVTVQSNVDGSWDTYSSWETANKALLQASKASDDKTTAVSGGVRHRDESNQWVVDAEPATATYTFEIPEDFTIKGPVAVHIRAAAAANSETPLSELDGIRLTVGLNDKSDSEFNAFVPSRSYLPITSTDNHNAWMGGGVENFALVSYTQTPATSKSIGMGYIDIFNPTAGYDSASAAKRTEIKENKYYDYTVYIQPTVYTVKEGHTIELTLSMGYNSGLDLKIDNSKTYIDMPTQGKVSFSQKPPSSSGNSGNSGSSGGTPVTPTTPVTPVNPTTPTTVGGFADVAADAWYADAVKYVQDKGLMSGTSASSFEPDANVNRAMVVTVLYRLAGSPATTGSNDFTDLSQDWYKDAVQWAVDAGVTNGTSATTFDPDAMITREQLAAMIFRYASSCGYDVSGRSVLDAFADSSSVSSYALEAMQWANNAGLINGVTNDTLVPTGDSNRAVLAIILMRFCENVAAAA